MYSQKDIRWGWHKLGSCNTTIGKAGCLLTCMAQLLSNHGVTINPGQLNKMFKLTGRYIDGCLLPDNALSKLYPDRIKLMGRVTPKTFSFSLLGREPGEEIILKIDANPAPGEQRHFVILKTVEDDKVTIADPIGGWVGDFSKRYGDPKKNILAVIKYYFKEVK